MSHSNNHKLRIMTNEEIVRQIRRDELSKSEGALRYIYEECYFICEQMILKNNGTKEDAKDTFQDALVVFYNNVKNPSFDLSSKISTYLYAVCRNLWLKSLRESKKYVEVDEEYMQSLEGGVVVPDKKEHSDTATMLADLLEQSGEKCLSLLKMFYFEKLKMKEISSAFGFASEQVAKNQKVRCLKKLRAILGNTDKYKEAFNL